MLFFVDTGLPKNSILFLKTAALALKILLFLISDVSSTCCLSTERQFVSFPTPVVCRLFQRAQEYVGDGNCFVPLIFWWKEKNQTEIVVLSVTNLSNWFQANRHSNCNKPLLDANRDVNIIIS